MVDIRFGEIMRPPLLTHDRKLTSLGIKNNLDPCEPDQVIFNYSSVHLSSRLRTLLAYGLDFCLPVYKLNFLKYFLCFEKLATSLAKGSPSCGNKDFFISTAIVSF